MRFARLVIVPALLASPAAALASGEKVFSCAGGDLTARHTVTLSRGRHEWAATMTVGKTSEKPQVLRKVAGSIEHEYRNASYRFYSMKKITMVGAVGPGATMHICL